MEQQECLSPVTAREVYQVLRDIALQTKTMHRIDNQPWADSHTGPVVVEVDGWGITLIIDCDTLSYCAACTTPDGRIGSLKTWPRFGTDPVSFLSQWEHDQLERLLRVL
ncbi:hypothetical protein [Pseudomonas sp.]|jgi:hypothetical protein|uniref:DUF7693 family protein n=1 Tax=Pseudomonas sp. TaxID=306 RepID=UPI0026190D64|nr:hypothetical protein [Pseudomonas sp.]